LVTEIHTASRGIDARTRLIARGNADIVAKTLSDRLQQRIWDFLLIVPLSLSGLPADRSRLERSLRSFRKSLIPHVDAIERAAADPNWRIHLLELAVTACEIGLTVGVTPTVIQHVIALLISPDQPPKKRYYGGSDAAVIDIILRAWLLQHHTKGSKATLEDFQNFIDPPQVEAVEPKRARGRSSKKEKPKHDEELRKCARAIFPVYEGRLAILARAAAGHTLGETDLDLIKVFGLQDYEFAREYWASAYRSMAAHSVLRLLHLPGIDPEKLFQKAYGLVQTRYHDPFAERLVGLWEELLLRPKCHDLILKGVVDKSEEAKAEKAPGSDKVRAFINFSRLVVNFSESDAQILFEEVIKLAQEIGREALDQIGVLEALAVHHAAWSEPNKVLAACQAFRFITDVAIRLRDEEHFPWDDAVRCLSRLSPPTALASISRWSDQGIRTHKYTLPPLILQLDSLKLLTADVSVALLALLEHRENQLLRTLSTSASSAPNESWAGPIEELARDCLLNTDPLERRADAKLILDAIKKVGRPSKRLILKQLAEVVSFLGRGKLATKGTANPPERKRKLLDVSGRSFRTTAEVEDAVRQARAMEEYSLKGLFQRMTAAINLPGDRVPFLNALADCKLDPFDDGYRLFAIADAINSWSPSSPSVAQWRVTRFSAVIAQHFYGLARWLNRWSDDLEKLLQSAGLSDADRQSVLIEGAEAAGLALGSSALFGTAELLGTSLSHADALAVFQWYLARLNSRIVGADTNELDFNDLPSSTDDAIGRFLFALLSDIDIRIRWRTAHVVRRLARLGATSAFRAVFSNYDRKVDSNFRDPNAPYYWIAARLWAVITAERIAHESPSVALSLAEQLQIIALDKDFPHLLIREHAKSALLQLVKSGHLSVPAEVLSAIEKVNTPQLARLPKADRAAYNGYRDSKERRFDFDMMDAAQYWFGPSSVSSPILIPIASMTGSNIGPSMSGTHRQRSNTGTSNRESSDMTSDDMVCTAPVTADSQRLSDTVLTLSGMRCFAASAIFCKHTHLQRNKRTTILLTIGSSDIH
jgi:hypothetical protein